MTSARSSEKMKRNETDPSTNERPKMNFIHNTKFEDSNQKLMNIQHLVVSDEEFKRAREALLEKEKALSRHLDEVTAARRNMPWRECKNYTFRSLEGKEVLLSDLFTNDKLDTLVLQHFMQGPTSSKGCPSCSLWAHGFNGYLPYINLRVNFAVVAKANFDVLKQYYESQHWSFNCVSSENSTFNIDFKAESEDGKGYADGQYPGVSVFTKRKGKIYHTYSTFGRGLDLLNGSHSLLDLTPLGRQSLNESLHECCGGWRPY